MGKRNGLRAGFVAAAFALAACTVGPNFQRPAPPTVSAYTPAPLAGAPFRYGAAVDAKWWTAFGSTELDADEDEALRANADLAAAEAALRQARELYLAQKASAFPTVTLGGSGLGAKNSATIASPLANNAEFYTLYQAQLNLTYQIDVFGGVRRATEAAAAQADNQRYLVEAAYLTLTTGVANAVLQIAGLNAQLDAVRDTIGADQHTLDLTRQEQRLGQASNADIAAAEAALAQAASAAPPLLKQIDQQRDLLAALMGRPSAAAPAADLTLASVRLPAELPVSLPADLVRQRPDVLAAEANLHVASAQVGVAIAARLPSFTLAASPGVTATDVASLFSGDNALWTITGDVAQTVFDAGAAKHRQKAAEAAFDQAKAQYRSAALGALQNVADVLQAIVADNDADRDAEAAAAATNRSLGLAEGAFKAGETGVLPVLSAQGAAAQAELALAQTRAARYADAVALFQALGGGWWNDPQRQADAAR
ncbi:MAG TPA: efflux transporter outer membrane subunit [Caulobacteraceae bacterium]|jgi:NodT family efflux transporter outer membrane factor (OMF) lipoprotein